MAKGRTKNVTVNFIVNSAEAEKKLKAVAAQIEGVKVSSAKTARSFTVLGKDMTKMNRVMGPFSSLVGGASYRLGAFSRVVQALPGPVQAAIVVIGALGYAFKQTYELSSKAEGAIATMIALTGSQTKAYELLNQAIASSRTTPFTPLQEVGAAGKLVQFGLTDPFTKGLTSMNRLGKEIKISQMDIFEALGSFTDIKGERIGLDRAIQGIMTGQKKMTRAFYNVIQDAWEATKKVTTVGSREWGKILLKNISKNFARVNELAEMQALTMKGMFSTIQGYQEEMWLAFSGVGQGGGLNLWTELKSLVLDIRNGLGSFAAYISPFLTSFGELLGVIVTHIWNVIQAMWSYFGPAIKFILSLALGLLQIIFEVTSGVIRTVWKIVAGVGSLIKRFLQWTGILGLGRDIMAWIVEYTKKAVLGLEIMFLFLGETIDAFFTDVGDWLSSLPDKIKGVIDSVYDYFSKKWNAVKEMVTGNRSKVSVELGETFNTTSGLTKEERKSFGIHSKPSFPSPSINNKNSTKNIDNSKKEVYVVPMNPPVTDFSNLTGLEGLFFE